MKIELFVNLRDSTNGIVVRRGIYDDSKGPIPNTLYREVEHHRKNGRRTLRILEEETPKQSPSAKKPQDEIVDTLDDQENHTQTSEEKSSGKRGRRRKSS